jgi:hypothetical protein
MYFIPYRFAVDPESLVKYNMSTRASRKLSHLGFIVLIIAAFATPHDHSLHCHPSDDPHAHDQGHHGDDGHGVAEDGLHASSHDQDAHQEHEKYLHSFTVLQRKDERKGEAFKANVLTIRTVSVFVDTDSGEEFFEAPSRASPEDGALNLPTGRSPPSTTIV